MDPRHVTILIESFRQLDSEYPVVRKLFACASLALQSQTKTLPESCFTSKDITRMLSGLSSSYNNQEVRQLMSIIAGFFPLVRDHFSLGCVSISLFGLTRLGTDLPETNAILSAILSKIPPLSQLESPTVQCVCMALQGLRGKTTDNPQVRELLRIFTETFPSCQQPFSPKGVAMSLNGLSECSSDCSELLSFLPVLTTFIQNSIRQRYSEQEFSMSLSGLKGKNSSFAPVRALLHSFNQIFEDPAYLPSRLSSLEASNCIEALSGMSSHHSEVRELLSILTPLLRKCTEPISFREVLFFLSGMRSLHSSHQEVRSLLSALTPLIRSCPESISPSLVSSILQSSPGLDPSHLEVQQLLETLARASKGWESVTRHHPLPSPPPFSIPS